MSFSAIIFSYSHRHDRLTNSKKDGLGDVMSFGTTIKREGYRPDIDGIRAVAVIAVILYHFNIPGFSGGFVGVDVFFVISGYLISKGIVSEVDKGNFGFGDFYARRTRRLIPALLSVIGITYFASYFIQTPNDFAQLSGSVVYALSGVSNIYFWMQSGYFDNFSSLKPLLHTWSLSAELQFYILWPVVLMIICKSIRRDVHRFFIVAGVTIILAAVSILHVKDDSSGAFFLTQYRMHEFTIGTIVVFVDRYLRSTLLSTVAYLLGLMMVIVPVFTYAANSIVFPGYYALIPCVGTALMICTGLKSRLSFILGSSVPVYIGEISYSLYLVHWPLFVLTSYVLIFPLTWLDTTLLIFATAIISLCLYYVIERPLRKPGSVLRSGAAFSLACSLLVIAIIIPSSSSWAEKGWVWRMPIELREINNIDISDTTGYTWEVQKKLAEKTKFESSNQKKILVIGDSQSADIINMMSESGAIKNFDVIARTIFYDCGTPYVAQEDEDVFFKKMNATTIARPELITKCKNQINSIVNGDLIKEADAVFISFYYQPNLDDYIRKGVEKIRTLTSAKIYVFGRKGLSKSSADIATSFNRIAGLDRYASKFIDTSTVDINNSISNYEGVKFINVFKFTCPRKDECFALTDNMKPVFYDPAHFTRFGAKFIGKKIFLDNKSLFD